MPRLRQNERERAIRVLAAGMTQVQVANNLNVSRMTIARLETRLRDTSTTMIAPVVTGQVKRRYVKTDTSASFITGFDLYTRHKLHDKPMEDMPTEYLLKQFVTDFVKFV
ncbi:Hypothetical predicted protein [Mytilus galloprovincialis]|uniref:HTH cro/C1-type domain-containing protein n=1 Tax=Mytilus galloprovincialis TaxID=29158 RepID=A0A8B6EUM7_MYTGA|nr:Hypothetical predicted protein [Mytilus galloprovincialis]